MNQNYEPMLMMPMPCPTCKTGTINPCHEEGDLYLLGRCNNQDCDFRIVGRDFLTGVATRPFVDNELPRILASAVDEGANLEVGLLDLDHFKLVGDTYGIWAGDEILAQLGQLLSEAAGPAGLAARIGGDEFLLLLSGDHIPERFEALHKKVESLDWERIYSGPWERRWEEMIAAGRAWSGSGLKVTVSIGVARLRPGQQTQAALLGQADRLLSAAKGAGRNRVVLEQADSGLFSDCATKRRPISSLRAGVGRRVEHDHRRRHAVLRVVIRGFGTIRNPSNWGPRSRQSTSKPSKTASVVENAQISGP